MVIVGVYFIVAVIVGVYFIIKGAVKDESYRICWTALIVCALIWPAIAIQLINCTIRYYVNSL